MLFTLFPLRTQHSMSGTLETSSCCNDDIIDASNHGPLTQLPSELLIGIIELVDNDHLDHRVDDMVPLANLRL
jgi:hypothetical protein